MIKQSSKQVFNDAVVGISDLESRALDGDGDAHKYLLFLYRMAYSAWADIADGKVTVYVAARESEATE